MRIDYDKLIRDQIPEIIERAGKKYSIEIMDDEEYRKYLIKKLLEEAQEAEKAEEGSLAKEIADIYEVLDAVIDIHDFDKEEILNLQNKRRLERGGFKKKMKLLWVEE
jgi:predicted house-cleaning noncanonical NTP pyrophosphatase (MazG superfamily)